MADKEGGKSHAKEPPGGGFAFFGPPYPFLFAELGSFTCTPTPPGRRGAPIQPTTQKNHTQLFPMVKSKELTSAKNPHFPR